MCVCVCVCSSETKLFQKNKSIGFFSMMENKQYIKKTESLSGVKCFVFLGFLDLFCILFCLVELRT